MKFMTICSWWPICLLAFQFFATIEGTQSAKYMCIEDINTPGLTSVLFEVEQNDDYISDVFAYDTATKRIQYQNCSASLENNGTFSFRLSVNLTSGHQYEPSYPCGYSHTTESITMTMRTFERLGLESASDRYFVFECKASDTFSSWKSTTGLTTGDVDVVNLNETRDVTLQIKDSVSRERAPYLLLGQKVFLEVSYTFSSSNEGLDPIGVRITDVVVAPTDVFAPLYRQMIDTNGCPVEYAESVLALTGPFSSFLTGPPTFTAESPVFEIGRFSGPSLYYLSFKATVRYCTSVNESCFTNMCVPSTRRRRSVPLSHDTKVISITLPIQSQPQSVSGGTTSYQDDVSCYRSFDFMLIASVAAILFTLEVFVISYLLVNIKHIEKQKQTS